MIRIIHHIVSHMNTSTYIHISNIHVSICHRHRHHHHHHHHRRRRCCRRSSHRHPHRICPGLDLRFILYILPNLIRSAAQETINTRKTTWYDMIRHDTTWYDMTWPWHAIWLHAIPFALLALHCRQYLMFSHFSACLKCLSISQHPAALHFRGLRFTYTVKRQNKIWTN